MNAPQIRAPLPPASGMEELTALSNALSKSELVPTHFRNKPANIFLALGYAQHLQEPALVVLQAMYVVSGKAGWSAEFMLSRLNRSGRIKGPVRYTTTGKDASLAVTATVTDAASEAEVSTTISLATAHAEGWTKNSKYKSMPEGMLRKRAITWLIRDHYPDVMGGFTASADELETIRDAEYEAATSRLGSINGGAKVERNGTAAANESEPEAEDAPDEPDAHSEWEPEEGFQF